jgi:hypothetical protein
MRRAKYIGFILILLFCGMQNALAQSPNSLVITGDRLVLTIDLKSSSAQIDSILKVAGIVAKTSAVKKDEFAAINNDGWQLASQQDGIARFERLLADADYDPQDMPFKITAEIPSIEGKPGYPGQVEFGINKYAKMTVMELASGLTRFILPGFERSKRVFLSGSFNNWSTLKGLMTRTEGGWILDEKLDAGVYEYKYIADGRWMTDPNNLQSVNDGAGNTNSVYFKYNYKFRLAGFAAAHKVAVSGDFNNWDPFELGMQKKGTAWERRLYLGDGRHEYRFMVDGQWITDPANPSKISSEEKNKSDDKYAYLNSVLKLGEPVTLKLEGRQAAKTVVLAGDFGNIEAADLKMEKKGGSWVVRLVLSPGNYDYRFIVDGVPLRDPANPHYSVKNGEEWSFLAVSPNYTFRLAHHARAKKVALCGIFNNWDPSGYTMDHQNDEWTISFHLKKGKYLYKFRVDGDWVRDPGNKLWEDDDGNDNSVLWIE